MQQDKGTQSFGQIDKVSKNVEQFTYNITQVCKTFKVESIFNRFDSVKRCGISISSLAMSLLLLPFYGESSVAALLVSGLNHAKSGEKDAYYDLKNNSKIDWRRLFLLICKRWVYILSSEQRNKTTALILDDSTLEKTGKKIENMGYVHDHVRNIFVLGYKIMVCGFYDGHSFIPIDFSFHKEMRNGGLQKAEARLQKKAEQIQAKKTEIRLQKQSLVKANQLFSQSKAAFGFKPNKTNERFFLSKEASLTKGKIKLAKLTEQLEALKENYQFLNNAFLELQTNHKPCGLTKSECAKQFKKKRAENTKGKERNQEVSTSKIDGAIKMLNRAVRNKFIPKYVLTDTWFFSKKIIQAVNDLGNNIKLVSMAKIGNAKYKILPCGKWMNPHQMIALYERKKGKNSKKYKARYISLKAEYQGIRVNVFLIRFGSHGTWRMLVTTDLRLNFTQLIQVYKIRWTIEVFFKECKQHLLLGKSQSRDFDAQIADTTLSMIRFVMLSYCQRTQHQATIGGLFKELSKTQQEEDLLSQIGMHFIELLHLFSDYAGIDIFVFFQNLMRDNHANEIFARTGIGNFIEKEINLAA